MDILVAFVNSPFSVIAVFLLVAGYIIYRKVSGADRKCGSCGDGVMEETMAKPEMLLGDTTTGTTAKTSVRMTVTYRCTNCGEKFTRSENRS